MKGFACVILAAGRGKRMKSHLVKVLHTLCGKPMLFYVLELSKKLNTVKTVLVVGRQKEKVMEEFKNWNLLFVEQTHPLGTSDAVRRTEGILKDMNGDILVLAGDTPLLREETIIRMMKLHSRTNSDITLLSTFLENPTGYGRILRKGDRVIGIVEEKDASEEEKSINEINAGVYIFKKDKLFQSLKKVKPDNIQQEYYLTDVVHLIHKEHGNIQVLRTDDWKETLGINDRWTLSYVSRILNERIMKVLSKDGVTFISPESTFIDYGVKINRDTIIQPFVSITGETTIGENCRISSHTSIHNSIVGNNVTINTHCFINQAHINDNSIIQAYSIFSDEKKEN